MIQHDFLRRIVRVHWNHDESESLTYSFALAGTRSSSVAGSCTAETPPRSVPAGTDFLATDYLASAQLVQVSGPIVPSGFTVVNPPTALGTFSYGAWEAYSRIFDAGPKRDLDGNGSLEGNPQLGYSGTGTGNQSVGLLDSAQFLDTTPHCYGGDTVSPGSYGVAVDIDGGKYQSTDGSTGHFGTSDSVQVDFLTSLHNDNDGRDWSLQGWNVTVTESHIVLSMNFTPDT